MAFGLGVRIYVGLERAKRKRSWAMKSRCGLDVRALQGFPQGCVIRCYSEGPPV